MAEIVIETCISAKGDESPSLFMSREDTDRRRWLAPCIFTPAPGPLPQGIAEGEASLM